MAYPTTITTYPSRIDKQASGWYVSGEYFNIPTASPYQMYLDHVPQQASNTKIYASGGAEWTEDTTGSPAATQFYVAYITGQVTFNSADTGTALEARYYSLGDDIIAEHMNNMQTEVLNIQNELGYNPSEHYADVSTRLEYIEASASGAITASGINGDWITDDTVRAGALKDDIKGATWSTTRDVLTDISAHVNDAVSGHAASAIAVTGPGSTTFVNVRDHIDALGSTTQTDTNPHGLTAADISAMGAVGDAFVNGILTVTGATIDGTVIRASGNAMAIDIDGPDEDQFLYFYEGSTANARQIAWDDTNNKFSMNDGLEIAGSFETEAITASGNINPEASGTRNLASLATSFGTGNFDEIQAVDYKTGASIGVDGSFTTNDGQTVIVKSGLIVSIA